MIPRTLGKRLLEMAGYYPVVVVTGPRQSGKTTLCRATFPDHAYLSLEALDSREFVQSDPRGFIAEYGAGAVIDEIQHAPSLLNYLQAEVDARSDPGRFILTGSQHFGLSHAVSQSLAGRSGILVLLPPSLDELVAFPNAPTTLYDALWQGAYPRIYDRRIPAHQWLSDYAATYLDRDVRQVLNIGDLQTFERFLKLCAGRTGQELNTAAIAGDAGVAVNTVRSWLSVLETSYIIHRLPAWHPNVRKQVVRRPKLHFLDSGLACYLLGIREPGQLRLHPLRGAIFESWVFAETFKGIAHRGDASDLYHYRESRGAEVDLLVLDGSRLTAVEVKSGETVASDAFADLGRFADRIASAGIPLRVSSCVVYGGSESRRQSGHELVPWQEVGRPGVRRT